MRPVLGKSAGGVQQLLAAGRGIPALAITPSICTLCGERNREWPLNSAQFGASGEHPLERSVRRALSGLLLSLQRRRRESFNSALAEDAWVIAPHPDDEVLGCGGTILLKRRLGADVRVVFLTDGRLRTGIGWTARKLAECRKAEALNACQALEVAPDRVFFLGLPDGRLRRVSMSARRSFASSLPSLPASSSSFRTGWRIRSDHKAARRAALAALADIRAPVRVFEYAVWRWDLWPWVRLEPGGSWPRRMARRAKRLLSTLRWLSGCRTFVDVREVLEAEAPRPARARIASSRLA